MIDSIIFDLDGTLTDSGEGIINCVIYALERFGLPIPERDSLRYFVGPPLHESFIKQGVPIDRAEEAVAVYRERYVPTGMFENTPYPGVRKLLDADIAVSVTGLAGPGGDDFGNPVGTVFIGYADKREALFREYHLEGDRAQIREKTILAALELVLERNS